MTSQTPTHSALVCRHHQSVSIKSVVFRNIIAAADDQRDFLVQ